MRHTKTMLEYKIGIYTNKKFSSKFYYRIQSQFRLYNMYMYNCILIRIILLYFLLLLAVQSVHLIFYKNPLQIVNTKTPCFDL